jgi:hypothetical protein
LKLFTLAVQGQGLPGDGEIEMVIRAVEVSRRGIEDLPGDDEIKMVT